MAGIQSEVRGFKACQGERKVVPFFFYAVHLIDAVRVMCRQAIYRAAGTAVLLRNMDQQQGGRSV